MENKNGQNEYENSPEQEKKCVFDTIVDIVMPTIIVLAIVILVYNMLK
jgi:mannose/fructose/N-acetylgalactosamine-specific phosphotransferase system component IID